MYVCKKSVEELKQNTKKRLTSKKSGKEIRRIKKILWDKQRTNNEIVALNPTISILTYYVKPIKHSNWKIEVNIMFLKGETQVKLSIRNIL